MIHKANNAALTNMFSRRAFAAGIRTSLFAAAIGLSPAFVSAWSPLSSKTDTIRKDIANIEEELQSLPLNPVNLSPWTLGCSTSQHKAADLPVILEVQFADAAAIDTVAFLPASSNNNLNRLESFGFPVRFMIERLLPDGSTKMLADYRNADYPTPWIEPQLFACPDPVPTSGLRITITKCAPNTTWWRASHIAAFSELFAFVGEHNVALNAEVKASSSFDFSYVWSPVCLTDGFSIFSPINHLLASPEENFISEREEEVILITLSNKFQIDEFRFWPVVHSIQHNFPQSSGVGFPEFFRIELAERADFSDARVIYQMDQLIQKPGAGPFMHRIEPASGQFIRVTLGKGFVDFRRKHHISIELSEMEFLEKGWVISHDATLQTAHEPDTPNNLKKLTDGFSNEGQILPLRQWVSQFKRRVDLERTLGALTLDLAAAQSAEKKRSTLLIFLALGLILLLLQALWLMRAAAYRRAARMRERIACDLHDEIGANISSIAHTAELLEETIKMPSETQSRLIENLVASARITSRETNHFIRFIEGENDDRELTEQFARVTDQILGTIPLNTKYQNIHDFNRLDPSVKWNLLLFFKEALNNIIKHAGASLVTIRTIRNGPFMMLTIIDNGCGFISGPATCRHLSSRAKTLGGKVEIDTRPGHGTRVTLSFKK